MASQPASPVWVILGTGLVAAFFVFAPMMWRVTEYAVTLAHEMGHGVMAAVTGGEVSAVHLRPDRSGQVLWMGKTRGLAAIAVIAAGYTGPTLFGLGAAAMLAADHTVGLLWAILILLGLLVMHIRTWFGLLVIVTAAGLVFCISWLLPVQLQSAFAYLVAWFLLLAAPRDLFALWSSVPSPHLISDVDQLAYLTGLPRQLWVGLLSIIAFGAIPVGAYWMLL